MKTNMGTADRLARIGTAILFSIFFIGGYMIGSTAIGYCPIYDAVGISTCKKGE
jgi:hypothetical protein